MGTFSIWHWLIVLLVVLVLFGGSGKISSLMGDMAKGIKSFKKAMKRTRSPPTSSRCITMPRSRRRRPSQRARSAAEARHLPVGRSGGKPPVPLK
jgi:sec-independent protein translocase protein TatA